MSQGNRPLLLEQLARYAYQWSPEKVYPLSSGGFSNEYLDCKSGLSRAEAMAALGPLLCSMLDSSIAAVGGLTMGADPLAMSASQASAQTGRALRWFSVRKDAKEHGLRKKIEGSVRQGERVAVFDDVVTKGDSTIKAIRACRDAGFVVVQVIVLVDREQFEGIAKIRQEAGVPVDAIFKKSEIATEWHRLNPMQNGLRATG
ncbi:MAG TPA: orotate phosphoribosyltransferase [Polyangiales bacterium]